MEKDIFHEHLDDDADQNDLIDANQASDTIADELSHGQASNDTPEKGITVRGVTISAQTVNVVGLGAGFFLLFFAFNTTQSFETSYNGTAGYVSLGTLYFFFSFSNLFSSTVVRTLTERYSLMFGGLVYTLYVAANIYVINWVLVLFSAALGIGAAVLWCAQGAFMSKNSSNETISLNSGIFFAMFMANSVAGNLFAGLLSELKINTYIMFSIFTLCGFAGSMLFLALRKPKQKKTGESVLSLREMMLETSLMLKESRMQFLLFWFVYSGLSQSFIYGNFPAVAGDLEQTLLFWMMAVWGVAEVIGSIAFGRLETYISRSTLVVYAGLLHCIALPLSVVAYQYGTLAASRVWLFYLTVIFLGLGDAGNNTMIYAVVSTFFSEKSEPAFAFFRFVQSSCSAIAFAYGIWLTVPWIVIILFPALVLGQVFVYMLNRFVDPIDQVFEAKDLNPAD